MLPLRVLDADVEACRDPSMALGIVAGACCASVGWVAGSRFCSASSAALAFASLLGALRQFLAGLRGERQPFGGR